MNTKDFIERGQVTHKENYDFSKSNYINSKTKITIICPEHGEFSMLPYNFLKGQGCPVCRYIKSSSHLRNNIDDFVKKAQEVHGNKYDYSKVDYKNTKTKVCIICPEHGEFWQTPCAHMQGQGCPQCKMSHLENKICRLLKDNNVIYEYESNINGILKRKTVDFYLPKINIAIECQGGQHFYG
jgi:hypothetical protein